MMTEQIEVFVYRFFKKDLLTLPEHERALVVQLGHVCNELAFFHKLLLVVSDTTQPSVRRECATAQALIVARVFIGKVSEAWLMLGKNYFGSSVRQEFDSSLDADAKESLSRLNKAFGSSNLLATVRNKFAFHYLPDHIEETLSLMDDDQELRVIGASSYDNTLYAFAENIATYGMLNKTDQSQPQAAMDELIGSLVEVGGDMLNYSSHLLGAILYERLGDKLVELESQRESFEVETNLEEFKMPFFFARGS